ncbi:MAG: hypothetical protein GF330_12115, partial [Candidatus Eisenbacteria bacterium]|nr:hypothetical protein [Candidatus Eisenbacteria bacterium]
IPREDLVHARVRFPDHPPAAVRVYGPDGVEVPSQVTGVTDDALDLIFIARMPPVGWSVFAVYATESPCTIDTGLRASQGALENRRYRIEIDRQTGRIRSIFDKQLETELLDAPHELQLLDDAPRDWAAWEIDYDDVMAPPRARVGGPVRVRVVENGPALVALETEREQDGSTFTERISLAARGAGDRVGIDLEIDWRTPGTLLKAAFDFAGAGDSATYDLGLGTIARGVNRPELYEVPAQRWAQLSAAGGARGVALLSDSRYGWDHPTPQMLRLTLLHTPVVNERWGWIEDQATQDLGRHRLGYAIYSHTGDWRAGAVGWVADRMNQPLLAFQPPRHAGALGRSFCFVQVETIGGGSTGAPVQTDHCARGVREEPRRPDGPHLAHAPPIRPGALPAVAVRAIKRAEESDELIVRLQELHGDAPVQIALHFPTPVRAVREVNGAEERLAEHHPALYASVTGTRTQLCDDGSVRAVLGPYQPKSLAIELAPPTHPGQPPAAKPLGLHYDLDGISADAQPADGDFDGRGHTLSSELLPRTIFCAGVPFITGPREPGAANLLTCQGQAIDLPREGFDQLYLLAASADGDRHTRFAIEIEDAAGRRGTELSSHWIQDYAEPVGQWDSRISGRQLIHDPQRIVPAYVKPERVAWVGTHRHDAEGENEAYQFTYLFLHRIALPDGAWRLRLPVDPKLRIAAATLARNAGAALRAAQPLFDRTERTSVRIETPWLDFVDQTDVILRSPNRGAQIHYTLDGSLPTESSPRYAEPIHLTETTTVRARALAKGLEEEFVATATFTRRQPRAAVRALNGRVGLRCHYYEGTWDALPDFSALTPQRSEIVSHVALPAFARAERMGLVFEGYLHVPARGLYTLHLWSDDGSALYLGESRLIDNDGLHGNREKWAHVALEAGAHPVRIEFFQNLGGVALDLRIEGPQFELQPVPEAWWLHGERAR